MSKVKQKVALEGARFFAHHGYYPEEQKIGNVFFLDIITEFDFHGNGDDDLAATVNYETLYQIASEEMNQTAKLLETVVFNILEKIKSRFPIAQFISVTMRKASPPFPSEVRYSSVSLTYNNEL